MRHVPPILEDYADFWCEPERFLLVTNNAMYADGTLHASIHHIPDLGAFILDGVDEFYPELLRRMRAAGVREMTREAYLDYRGRSSDSSCPLFVEPQPEAGPHGGLVQLADGRFQIVFPGPLRDLICGHEHILAVHPLVAALSTACGEQFDTAPAVIYDPATGTELRTYTHLLPRQELTPEKASSREFTGDIWHFRRSHLFVSARVRDALESAEVGGVEFYPGFSRFGGVG